MVQLRLFHSHSSIFLSLGFSLKWCFSIVLWFFLFQIRLGQIFQCGLFAVLPGHCSGGCAVRARGGSPTAQSTCWTPGHHLPSGTLQLSTAVLTEGSILQVQLCLRWNMPDISVSVQHSRFVGPMTVQNRRGERSGRAANSELSWKNTQVGKMLRLNRSKLWSKGGRVLICCFFFWCPSACWILISGLFRHTLNGLVWFQGSLCFGQEVALVTSTTIPGTLWYYKWSSLNYLIGITHTTPSPLTELILNYFFEYSFFLMGTPLFSFQGNWNWISCEQGDWKSRESHLQGL